MKKLSKLSRHLMEVSRRGNSRVLPTSPHFSPAAPQGHQPHTHLQPNTHYIYIYHLIIPLLFYTYTNFSPPIIPILSIHRLCSLYLSSLLSFFSLLSLSASSSYLIIAAADVCYIQISYTHCYLCCGCLRFLRDHLIDVY